MTGLNGVNGRTEEIPSGTRQQDMSKSLPEEPRGGQVHNGTKEDMAVRGEPRPHMPASNGRDQQSLQFYSNPSFFPPSNNYYPPGPSSYLPAQTLFPTGHQQQQQATNIPVKTEETLIKGSALPTMTMETPSL